MNQYKNDPFLPSHLWKINVAPAHKSGYFGEGIGIAVLDTGVYLHPDLCIRRNTVAAFSDFVAGKKHPYDDANHGTHICGIIASNRRDAYSNYYGIAPSCHIICGKILDAAGNGKTSTALTGFGWIYQLKEQYNIRIINISMGMAANHPKDEFTPFMNAVNELWDMGFVVITAAGNDGPAPGSITIPGIGRKIITVGSCRESFSGQGPTINKIPKPDLCAPGSMIYSCGNRGRGYVNKTGTSMSTPMVSAAAALLLSKEPWLTNEEVKRRLVSSARNLSLPWRQQGAGMLDVGRLLGV